MVVQAYILVQTNVGKAADVARAIGAIQGVTLAEDVTVRTTSSFALRRRAWMNLASSWLPRSKASPASPGQSPVQSSTSEAARLLGRRAGRGDKPYGLLSCRVSA